MKFYLPGILISVLSGIISTDCTPIIPDLVKTDANNFDSSLNAGKVVKQNNGNTGTGTNQGGNGNVPSAVTNFIGSNVADIVSSSLTGNIGGIFNGGLNLLNTNNRVNNLFGGVFGGTVPSPLGNIGNRLIITPATTTRTAATEAAAESSESNGTDEGEDGEDDNYDASKV